jgi:hypothetical protein
MGDLSKNFSAWEFQCPSSGISNPDSLLIQALQKYRDAIGVPIKITSGGRIGEKQGYHKVSVDIKSKAADVIPMGISLLESYYAALDIHQFMNGGIGIYPNTIDVNTGFLHLDVRGFFSRWSRIEGIYKAHQDGLNYIKNGLIKKGGNIETKSFDQMGHIYEIPYFVR